MRLERAVVEGRNEEIICARWLIEYKGEKILVLSHINTPLGVLSYHQIHIKRTPKKMLRDISNIRKDIL